MGKIIPCIIYAQSYNYCGPATLRSWIRYWYGVNVPEEDIAFLTKTSREEGCEAGNMIHALEEFGAKVVHLTEDGTIAQLERCVDQEILPIVCYHDPTHANGDPTSGHWGLFVGYNEKDIFIGDPVIHKRKPIQRDEFYENWIARENGKIEVNAVIAVPRYKKVSLIDLLNGG